MAAAQTVDTWAVRLTADVSDFQRGMNQLISQISQVQTNIAGMTANIQTTLSQSFSSSSLTTNISSITEQTSNLGDAFGRVGRVVAGIVSVGAIVKFGKECINLGSDLAEVQNVVDVTFPTMASEVNRFAKSAIANFGMSETAAKQYVGSLGAMLKSMGLAERTAGSMAESMTGLAGDIASFYNLDIETAFNTIRSGISGETEPLKQLGINMSVANLQAYALAQGITTAYNKMSEAEKATLRYNYLLSVTADAQGDFARTSSGYANSVRQLSENFNSLKASIGQLLVKVIEPMLGALNAMLIKINAIATAFSNLVTQFTGTKDASDDASSKAAAQAKLAADSAYAESDDVISDTAAATSKKANSTAESAIKKADKAAKSIRAAQAMLLSIDELNKMDDTSADSSGTDTLSVDAIDATEQLAKTDAGQLADDMGNVADSVGDISETTESLPGVLDAIIDRAKELAGIFNEGFTAGLGDDFADRWQTIKDSVSGIGESLKEIFTDSEVQDAATNFADRFTYALGQIAGATVSYGVTIGANITGGIDKFLKQNTPRIKKYMISMFDIKGDIAELVGNWAQSIADIFSVWANEDGQQITADIIGIFADAAMGINELFGKALRDILNVVVQPIIDNVAQLKTDFEVTLPIIEEVTAALKEMVDSTVDSFNSMYDEHIKPYVDAIADGISSVVGQIAEIYEQSIAPVLEKLAEKFVGVKDSFNGAIGELTEAVGKVFDKLKVVQEALQPVYEFLIKYFLPILADVSGFITGTFLDAFSAIISFAGDVIGAFGDIIDFITNIFTGNFEGALQSVKDFAEDIFNAIVDAINFLITPLTNLVDLLTDNAIVNGIKNIFSGGEKASEVDWNSAQWAGPAIQTRATGGTVERGELFIANEAGPELVGKIGGHTTVANNQQIVEAVSSGVADAVMGVMMATQGDNQSDKTILITLDGEEIGRGVTKALAKQDKRNNLTINYAY